MNPITSARIDAGLSKQKLSQMLRLSKTFIIRAEQGCYSNPGSKLIEFSTERLAISQGEFKRQYQSFQNDVRTKTALNVTEKLTLPNRIRADQLPDKVVIDAMSDGPPVKFTVDDKQAVKIELYRVFRKWREKFWQSPITFSSAMCVHPSSVDAYERGDYDIMPALMIDALASVELIDKSFDPLIDWTYVWETD